MGDAEELDDFGIRVVDRASMSAAEIKADAYPGFSMTCDACGSPRVSIENASAAGSRAVAEEVALVCLDCGNRVEVA